MKENIDSNYKLNPYAYLKIEDYYLNETDYGELLEKSRKVFTHENRLDEINDYFIENENKEFRDALTNEELGFILSKEEKFDLNNFQQEDLIEVLDIILKPSVDLEIKKYLKSNYAVIWFGYREVTDNIENVSSKWHCDGAPSEHIKTITYLTSSDSHGSSTYTYNSDITLKLKKIGYVFCDVEERKDDIADLLEYHNIENEPNSRNFDEGDTFVFNPYKIIHKAGLPNKGSVRKCFDLCILPSPLPWKEVIQKGVIPNNGCVDFNPFFRKLIEIDQDDSIKPYIINKDGSIDNEFTLEHFLEILTKEKPFAKTVSKQIIEHTKGHFKFADMEVLLNSIKSSFGTSIKWTSTLNPSERKRLSRILEFEENLFQSMIQYSPINKPKPDAIFWPIPNHAKHPRSKYDSLPYVKKHEIMNKSTPISSAGSCFAFEIAKVLQEQDFNYVISERANTVEDGIIVDGFSPEDKYVKFSANYGILFNTPSLLQLAQKAFSLKKFQPYLIELPNNLLMDPYRENVFFKNRSSYINDYSKHIAAIKNTLLESEVFVFTAGLNECWALEDGTVLSRNPRNGFHHMIQHKTLTAQENVDNMSNFFMEVKKRNPKFKMVLTLSPIPLLATGRAETHHIIEANTHSKAVLRVAVEEVVNKFEDVYYLPSYELVTECMPNAWLDDHRHVTEETVSRVVEMFKEMFMKS